jgi:hypothetical protein
VFEDVRLLFVILSAGGISYKFVVFGEVRWGTQHFSDIELGWLQVETDLIKGYPRFCVHLRVINNDREF